MSQSLELAARAIRDSDAVLIATGAGMGVDSGLPDFRGNEGFWNAYPPFKKLGLSFYDLANPKWFNSSPRQAWGFYGHRFHLYQSTRPHRGYALLQHWSATKPLGYFCFTSNVDCHFQAAGFDPNQLVECHGSFAHLQCSRPCHQRIWPASGLSVSVDPKTLLADPPLPTCPDCGAVARPNILMFNDWNWIGHHSHDQMRRFTRWLEAIQDQRLTIIEIGAGTSVPTVRAESENLFAASRATLIRINPRESHGPTGTISIPDGGLSALNQINEAMNND